MSQCRICDSLNVRSVVDLGAMPLANRLKPAPDAPEKRFPLEVEFCRDCGNLQLTHCVDAADLYDDYLYVTPTSAALEAHNVNLFYHMRARGYLPEDAFLLEFGSNVGHFLKLRPEPGRPGARHRPGEGDRRDGERPRRADALRLLRPRDRRGDRRRARPRPRSSSGGTAPRTTPTRTRWSRAPGARSTRAGSS